MADGPHGCRELGFEAHVLPDIVYEPLALTFESGKPSRQIVAFSPGELKEVVITPPHCTHRAFQATLRREQRQAEVAFDPSAWSTDTSGAQPEVKTNSPREPILRIRLLVEASESGPTVAPGTFLNSKQKTLL